MIRKRNISGRGGYPQVGSRRVRRWRGGFPQGGRGALSPLGAALGVLENEVTELAIEIRRLKEKARLLESENKSLRRRLATGVTPPEPGLAAQEDHLSELYRDGFHVCQLYFGKRLEGGCLLCVSLLRRRRSQP